MTGTDSQDWLVALFATVDPTAKDEPTIRRKTCARCSGTGRLSYYSHIKGGQCFACSGTGIK